MCPLGSKEKCRKKSGKAVIRIVPALFGSEEGVYSKRSLVKCESSAEDKASTIHFYTVKEETSLSAHRDANKIGLLKMKSLSTFTQTQPVD